ncbi:YidH family protein [Cupriavidus necator]
MHPKAWYKQGTDPDYRFTLANERTFLAWVRTNLALLATIIVFDHLAESSAYCGLLRALCLGLLLVAGVLVLAPISSGEPMRSRCGMPEACQLASSSRWSALRSSL